MKTIALHFDSYYQENEINKMPETAGIYCVYASRWIKKMNSEKNDNRLIYIGQAVNVKERISSHDKMEAFLNHLFETETLLYTVALISKTDLDRAEAALVYYHDPLFNTDLINTFSFPDTTIRCYGHIPRLERNFIVSPESD